MKVLSGEIRTSDSSSTNREDPLFKEEGEVMVDEEEEEEEGSSRDGRASKSREDRREVGIGKMGLGMFDEAEWSLHKRIEWNGASFVSTVEIDYGNKLLRNVTSNLVLFASSCLTKLFY